MAIRKIIYIEEEKCNGCGLCVPNCAEGAIQIINGKARLVKDSYCDGLGACLGNCPQDALHIEEREADDFNEEEAIEFVKAMKSSTNTIVESKKKEAGHHLHGKGGCPGSRMMMFDAEDSTMSNSLIGGNRGISTRIKSQLRQWPVQLNLVPVRAPYFSGADLLVTADCVPFAYPNYHMDLLSGKTVVVGCPKLDDLEHYIDKLAQIFAGNDLKSITVAYMEVPCCSGIVRAVDIAMQRAAKSIPVTKVRISINGEAEYR